MTKLSPSLIAILASACGRDDGIAIRPGELKMAGAIKAAAKLVELALVREIRTKGDMPTWCQTEQGHFVSLKILKAGRDVVQASAPKIADDRCEAASAVPVGDNRTSTKAEALPLAHAGGKAGSKRALILTLLCREEGATIDGLMEATGWLPHTTRAALSVLRKSGIAIDRRVEDGGSIYRIDSAAAPSAAA